MVRRQKIKRKKEREFHSNWLGSRRKERKKYTQEKDRKQKKKEKR
jgi:hypothetical protein